MNKLLSKTKETLAMAGVTVAAFASSTMNLLADGTALSTGIEKGANEIIKEIDKIYCGSVAWLLLIINLVVLAFSKDDKVIGIAKRTLATIVVAFIGIKILASSGGGVIGSTIDTIVGWVNGG